MSAQVGKCEQCENINFLSNGICYSCWILNSTGRRPIAEEIIRIKDLEKQRDFWINKDIKNLKRIKELEESAKTRIEAYNEGYKQGYNDCLMNI